MILAILYLFVAVSTGFACYSRLYEQGDCTEESMLQGSVVCGLFWPFYFSVKVIKKIIIYLA